MKLWMATVLTAALVACGTGPAETSSPSSTLPAEPSTTIVTTTTTTTAPEGSGLATAAVEDLADRLGVDAGEVEIVDSELVTWNDGSLGCPEPGMAYTQALVAGWRATLSYDGVEYRYHAAVDGEPFLCERPSPSGTAPTS